VLGRLSLKDLLRNEQEMSAFPGAHGVPLPVVTRTN